MANSREAQFQWDITKDMIARDWMAGRAGDELTGEYVSELELPHYRLTKREAERLRLEMAGKDYGLTSVSDVRSAGKPHDTENQRLAEIIVRFNDLYGAEVSDDDKLHFANGIADRIERDEAVMAQVRNHSEDQMMHGLFPKKVTDAVLDALSDHEKISTLSVEDEETGRQFSLLILKLLTGRWNHEIHARKRSIEKCSYDR